MTIGCDHPVGEFDIVCQVCGALVVDAPPTLDDIDQLRDELRAAQWATTAAFAAWRAECAHLDELRARIDTLTTRYLTDAARPLVDG
jgi:hypothetical protein